MYIIIDISLFVCSVRREKFILKVVLFAFPVPVTLLVNKVTIAFAKDALLEWATDL